MNDEDFSADIDAAIDNGGSLPITKDVTSEPETKTATAEGKASVVEEVSERISPEPVKQKEPPEAPKPKSAPKDTAPEATTETKEAPQKLFLDTFLGEDASGNLVTHDGVVVATKGEARRYYEGVKREGRAARDAAEKMAITNVNLGQKFKELYNEYKSLQNSDIHKDITTRTGMNSSEIEEAVQIMKVFKEDPLTGVKQILTRAHLQGIDLKELGINGGIDLATIREAMEGAVENKLQAVTKPVRDTPEKREARIKGAVNEVQAFMKRHGNVSEEEIAAISKAKQQFPQQSLDSLLFAFRRSSRKKSEEEAAKTWKDRPVKQQAEAPRQRKVVQTNNPDYATMSFDDIAESILKDA